MDLNTEEGKSALFMLQRQKNAVCCKQFVGHSNSLTPPNKRLISPRKDQEEVKDEGMESDELGGRMRESRCDAYQEIATHRVCLREHKGDCSV